MKHSARAYTEAEREDLRETSERHRMAPISSWNSQPLCVFGISTQFQSERLGRCDGRPIMGCLCNSSSTQMTLSKLRWWESQGPEPVAFGSKEPPSAASIRDLEHQGNRRRTLAILFYHIYKTHRQPLEYVVPSVSWVQISFLGLGPVGPYNGFLKPFASIRAVHLSISRLHGSADCL